MPGNEIAGGSGMRTLSAGDIATLLPMRDAIAVVAGAFAAISRSEGIYPPRLHLPLLEGDALMMPGYDGQSYLGMKIATIHARDSEHGKQGTRGSYFLVDARDGEPLLSCDGTALTALRTGAASGLATRRLARKDAKVLALFGVGSQAPAQLEAMFAVRPIEEVRIVGRDRARTDRFVAAARLRYPRASVDRSDAQSAVDGAQIVVTATSASSPVFDGRRIDAGTHVNAIGSFRPDMRELDCALMRRARLVVDQRAAARAEAGEVIEAIAEGITSADEIVELGEIGDDARTSANEITVFKTVGHAALDLFTAVELYRRSMLRFKAQGQTE